MIFELNPQDTDALVEAIESGNVEVNFMDDVGQTLLNWASAFGTQEMVEFLCRKGADVNKGHRSSSLHYAACFGRPAIARVLLRFGANPDLRDEDGKTPLDKARERNDEGHREVAGILQSPADWLTIANANVEEADEDEEAEAAAAEGRIEVEVAADVAQAASAQIPQEQATAAGPEATPAESAAAEAAGEGEKKEETSSDAKKTEPQPQPEPQPQGPKGDPEMIPVYARSLLPMFCHTFQSSMIATVKKSSLGLIKKIVHYLEPALLEEVCGANRHLVGEFVEVLTSVLDNEEDEEGHLTCLLIIQDLMVKDGEGLFLEHFAKLGLYSKVHSLAEEPADTPDLAESPEAGSSSSQGEILPPPTVQEDAKEIVQGKAYTWRDWSLARGRDCLYIWSDAAALELSNGSNGWFRFILDGKLATMYSSGSPEGGSDSSENRGEFLEKLQRARAAVTTAAIDAAAAAASSPASPGSGSSASASAAVVAAAASASVAAPVFTKKSADVIAVGNWNLSCGTDGELSIINSDGQQQATILREDLPGFLFQSNRGTRHTFTAETSLGPEFAAGWTSGPGGAGGRGGRGGKGRLKGKMEAVKQRVKSTAKLIYENYFRAAQATPRGVVATLANIVTKIDNNCQKQLVSQIILD